MEVSSMKNKFIMPQQEIDFLERVNSNSSKTNNVEFNKKGYLIIKNLWDWKDLYCDVPDLRGQLMYNGDTFVHNPEEDQVSGSLSRYYYPVYKFAHSQIRKKLEKIIGNELYNTYYYDRFYFPGQELTNHVDRDSCEISVTIHVSTNLKEPWPICIKTPDTYEHPDKKMTILKKGENASIILNPGDGMVYKGCERPHWRSPMPTEYKRTWYGRRKEKEGLYYHQVFFHYVLADGYRTEFAGDRR